ncbi:MAG: hypothetical protein R6X02_15505 [Enhygromyxa sp.]
MSDFNPYSAPSAAADAPALGRSFELSDEVRRLVARTSMVMIIAASLQLASRVIDLFTTEFDEFDVALTALLGVVPVFILLAGAALRRMATPGDDQNALLTGLRRLHVVFFIKGLILLLLMIGSCLTVLWTFLA